MGSHQNHGWDHVARKSEHRYQSESSRSFHEDRRPFIVLFDVERKDGVKTVLFVNKNNIVWVEPEDH